LADHNINIIDKTGGGSKGRPGTPTPRAASGGADINKIVKPLADALAKALKGLPAEVGKEVDNALRKASRQSTAPTTVATSDKSGGGLKSSDITRILTNAMKDKGSATPAGDNKKLEGKIDVLAKVLTNVERAISKKSDSGPAAKGGKLEGVKELATNLKALTDKLGKISKETGDKTDNAQIKKLTAALDGFSQKAKSMVQKVETVVDTNKVKKKVKDAAVGALKEAAKEKLNIDIDDKKIQAGAKALGKAYEKAGKDGLKKAATDGAKQIASEVTKNLAKEKLNIDIDDEGIKKGAKTLKSVCKKAAEEGIVEGAKAGFKAARNLSGGVRTLGQHSPSALAQRGPIMSTVPMQGSRFETMMPHRMRPIGGPAVGGGMSGPVARHHGTAGGGSAPIREIKAKAEKDSVKMVETVLDSYANAVQTITKKMPTTEQQQKFSKPHREQYREFRDAASTGGAKKVQAAADKLAGKLQNFKDFEDVVKSLRELRDAATAAIEAHNLEAATARNVAEAKNKNAAAINKQTSVIEKQTSEMKQSGGTPAPRQQRPQQRQPRPQQPPRRQAAATSAPDHTQYLETQTEKLKATLRAPAISSYTPSLVKPSETGNVRLKPTSGSDMNTFARDGQKAVERNMQQLSKSLNDLQSFIIKNLEKNLKESNRGWEVVKRKGKGIAGNAQYFQPIGGEGEADAREWRLRLANAGKLRQKLGNKAKGKSVPQMVNAYIEELSKETTTEIKRQSSTSGDKNAMARAVGKWVKEASEADIKANKALNNTLKDSLVEIKKEAKGGGVVPSEAMVDKIQKAVSGSGSNMEMVLTKTFSKARATKKVKDEKLIKDLAIPAAQQTSAGNLVFRTSTGTERGLSSFATHKTGFEEIITKLQRMTGRQGYNLDKDTVKSLKNLSIRPRGAEIKTAENVAQTMLKKLVDVGGKKGQDQKGFVREQYKAAAARKEATKQRLLGKTPEEAASKIKEFEATIDNAIKAFDAGPSEKKTMENFFKKMKEAGVSAYDVVRSMESISHENVYDVMKKSLGQSGAVKRIGQNPGFRSSYGGFESRVRKIEQMMPDIKPNAPLRGMHQQNVVQVTGRTVVGGGGGFDPEKQKAYITDMNLQLRELFKDVEMLSKAGIKNRPKTSGLTRLSSIGLPEEQAGKYDPSEFTPQGATIKMYQGNLREQSPAGIGFQATQRNITNFTNAISSSAEDLEKLMGTQIKGVTSQFPGLRSQTERDTIASGRYGTKGYGFNVLAEMRHNSGTFEDQIMVSGKLAEALTSITKTLIRPSMMGRVGDDKDPSAQGVGKVREGILKDVDAFGDAVNEVSSVIQERMGVSEKYKGRASKALITEVRDVIQTNQGESVEVQSAKLAEVFVNHFGRKFTTRFGSKGVSMTPQGSFANIMSQHKGIIDAGKVKVLDKKEREKAGLGVAMMPKSMGELAADLLDPLIEDLGKNTGEGKNLSKLKKQLIDAGNKFMISMFRDADKGVADAGEANVMQDLYEQFSDKMREHYDFDFGSGGNLKSDIAEIQKLKKAHADAGGKQFKERAIDVRISSYGAAKRGLQTEAMEAIINNVIGASETTQTTLQDDLSKKSTTEMLLGKEKQAGALAKYSEVLGFSSSRGGTIASRMEGYKDIDTAAMSIKDAAKMLEDASSYYVDIVDEFGKQRKSLVGEKFLGIIEEPGATEGWSKSQIEEGKKGLSLNLVAQSAFANVFGENSAMMRELRSRTTPDTQKATEILKSLQTNPYGGNEDLRESLLGSGSNLQVVDVNEIKRFDERTGTLGPAQDPNSFRGTIVDTEKFAEAFKLMIPKTTGEGAGKEREGFYVPGALAREIFPSPKVAGEYDMSGIGRKLSHLVGMAQDVSSFEDDWFKEKKREASEQGKDYAKDMLAPQMSKAYGKLVAGVKKHDPEAMAQIEKAYDQVRSIMAEGGHGAPGGFVASQYYRGKKDNPANYQGRDFAGFMDFVARGKSTGGKMTHQGMANAVGQALDFFAKKDPGEGASSRDKQKFSTRRMNYLDDKYADSPHAHFRQRYDETKNQMLRFGQALGVDPQKEVEQRRAKKIAGLEKAKLDYFSELSDQAVGKRGAVAQTMFTLEAPAMIGKGTVASVDKTKDLAEFVGKLSDISDMVSKAGIDAAPLEEVGKGVDSIFKTHLDNVNKLKAAGMPVLEQDQLAIPEEYARQLKTDFTKMFSIKEDKDTGALEAKQMGAPKGVSGTLFDLLSYKEKLEEAMTNAGQELQTQIEKHIEEDLTPYVESVRFPFTGTSSLQPYKPTLAKGEMASQSVLVPGIPELPYDEKGGLKDQIESLKTFRKDLMARREGLQNEADPDTAAIDKLTAIIEELDTAFSQLLPKYTAHAMKLDYDGDQVEIHAARTLDARKDVQKHFKALTTGTTSVEERWRDFYASDAMQPSVGEDIMRSSAESFNKKFPRAEGFDYMKQPFLNESLDFLSPAKQIELIAQRGPSVGQGMEKLIEDTLTGMAPDQTVSAIISEFKKVMASSRLPQKGKEESDQIAYANAVEKLGEKLITIVKDVGGEDLEALFKGGVREDLYSRKLEDSTLAQLFKLNTGKDVESLSRLHRVSEMYTGFGGGLANPNAKDEMRPEFAARWGETAALGDGAKAFNSMMNEFYRFAVQKGMDVKHAGARPIAGEMVGAVTGAPGGGIEALWKKIENSEGSYKDFKEFADVIEDSIRKRLGATDTRTIRKDLERVHEARGIDAPIASDREGLIKQTVETMGLKGFLEELSYMIKEEAIKGIQAMEGLGTGPEARAAAEKILAKETEKRGIDVTGRIIEPNQPLYNLRTGSAGGERFDKELQDYVNTQVARYKGSGGGFERGPEDFGFMGHNKAINEAYGNYEKIVATSRNLQRGMSEVPETDQIGGYAAATGGAVERARKLQTQRFSEYYNIQDYMGAEPDTGFGNLASRLKSGQYSSLQGEALEMNRGGMRERVDELSLLTGLSRLSDTERTEIKGRNIQSVTQDAIDKVQSQMSDTDLAQLDELHGEWEGFADYKKNVKKVVDDTLGKLEALAQLDKVQKALVRQASQGDANEALFPSKRKFDPSMYGEPDTGAGWFAATPDFYDMGGMEAAADEQTYRDQSRDLNDAVDRAKDMSRVAQEDALNSMAESYEPADFGGGSRRTTTGGGGATPPAGGAADMMGRGGIVPVFIMGIANGVAFNMQEVQAKVAEFASEQPPANPVDFDRARALARGAAGGANEMQGTTYGHIYRASGLHGGGTYGIKKKDLTNEEKRLEAQIKSIMDQMMGKKIHEREKDPKKRERLKKLLDSTSILGTGIHEKLGSDQKRRLGDRIELERFVALTKKITGEAGTVTGHVDAIYKDEGGTPTKVADIKTVSEKIVSSIGKGKTSDFEQIKNKVTKDARYKLEEAVSQINFYLKAVAEQEGMDAKDLKGEVYLVDRENLDNWAKVQFEFDESRFKRDMAAIAEARKRVRKLPGKSSEKFAKTASRVELEKTSKEIAKPENQLTDEQVNYVIEQGRAYFEQVMQEFGRKKSGRPPQHSGISSAQMGPGNFSDAMNDLSKHIQSQSEMAELRSRDLMEDFDIPKRPVEGFDLESVFTNLKNLLEGTIDYQSRYKDVDYDTDFTKMPEEIKTALAQTRKEGLGGKEFAEAMDIAKQEEDMTYTDTIKAWKLWRMAMGRFFIAKGEEAQQAIVEMQDAGDEQGTKKAQRRFERIIGNMQRNIKSGLGKATDIYTDKRRFIDPHMARSAGVYMDPQQRINRSMNPLKEDQEMRGIFKNITTDLTSGDPREMKAPILKAREALKAMTGEHKDLVEILLDAEQLKRLGPEVEDAWDFKKMVYQVTHLREALETLKRFSFSNESDAAQRKNLEGVINYFKQIEKAYTNIDVAGITDPNRKSEWGQMGTLPVMKTLAPKDQLAMHKRNLEKVREYFKKAESEGGAKMGERYSYMMPVFGEMGDLISKQIVHFQKMGEAIDENSKKIGRFKERAEDLFEYTQGRNKTFGAAISRAVRWGAASTIVYGGVSQLKGMASQVADIESSMASLRMVMSPLETDFDMMEKAALGFAKEFGNSTIEVLKSMKVFAQQGLSQEEVLDRTRVATLAANVTTLSAKEATEALTAAVKIYRQEGDSTIRFLDSWSEVESKHAITADDMANAIKKSASAAKNAGVTFDQLNGIVAAIGATTRQTGKEVGTSLRFIFRRLSSEKGPKELAKIGVPVMTEEGDLRQGFDILSDLAGQWDTLTNAQRMNIAQAIGGTRQYNQVLVLMEQWDEALRAIQNSTNSKGSAERRNVELMKTYEKQLMQTKAAAAEVQVQFGKAFLPIAKTGLKAVKTFYEAIANIPAPIKAAATGFALLLTYLAKGQTLISKFFDFKAQGSGVISDMVNSIKGGMSKGLHEVFGTGDIDLKRFRGMTTLQMDKTPSGQDIDVTSFETALGKSVYLMKKYGTEYNQWLAGLLVDTENQSEGKMSKISKTVSEKLNVAAQGLKRFGGADELMEGFDRTTIDKALTAGANALGNSAEYAAKGVDVVREKFGDAAAGIAGSLLEKSPGLVKAIAPLAVTLTAAAGGASALYSQYTKLSKGAADYEKVMYGVKREQETGLSTTRELMGDYDMLNNKLGKADRARDPKNKKIQQELGKYRSPLLQMADVQDEATKVSNKLADSNLGLIAGYDSLGNAVLNASDNYKAFLQTVEKSKIKEIAQTDVDVLGKYVHDLTATDGIENMKSFIKDFADEIPLLGEMISKGVKVAPAKVLDLATDQINKMVVARSKSPLTTTYDKDLKEMQERLNKARTSFQDTYQSFKEILTSKLDTEGLERSDIVELLTDDKLRKGYELMLEVEPRFQLKETKGKISAEDVMGSEVLKRSFKNLASYIDADAQLTQARLESAGINARPKGRGGRTTVKSGDIAIFAEDAAKEFDMAGNQAIISIKKNIDGIYEATATYFDTKQLKIVERAFDTDMQKLAENIFPSNAIQEDISDRIEALNEFVAGASAGLRGMSAKDFKRDLNLGERFFSDIASTTLLQTDQGYTPGQGFGKSRYQTGFKDSFKEFYAQPMQQYQLKMEQLDKLKLSGLEGGSVTLAKGLYDELTELQNVLKNNQAALQFRMVLIDLTKTMEASSRAMKENVAVEKTRLEITKRQSGYMKGISEYGNLDLGAQSYSELSDMDRALMGSSRARSAANALQVANIRRSGFEGQITEADKSRVALDSILEVSKGFGATLSPEEMKKYTKAVADTGSKEAAAMVVETGKVVDNTAQTVSKLDQILENMGDPDAIANVMSSWTDGIGIFGNKTVDALERVAKIRDKAAAKGDANAVTTANKAIDTLTKSLVDEYGLEGAAKKVRSNDSIFGKQYFKEGELLQRAFGGMDLKTFTDKMEKASPGFKDSKEMKKLADLQKDDGKTAMISSKAAIKTAAAAAVFTQISKKTSSQTLKKLEEQVMLAEAQLQDVKRGGGDTTEQQEKVDALKLAVEKEAKTMDLFKMTQLLTAGGAGAGLLANKLGAGTGMTNAAVAAPAATYAAMKVASMALGTELPDAAKDFGEHLKNATAEAAQGDLGLVDKAKLYFSAKKFQSYVDENKKRTGLSDEDLQDDLKQYVDKNPNLKYDASLLKERFSSQRRRDEFYSGLRPEERMKHFKEQGADYADYANMMAGIEKKQQELFKEGKFKKGTDEYKSYKEEAIEKQKAFEENVGEEMAKKIAELYPNSLGTSIGAKRGAVTAQEAAGAAFDRIGAGDLGLALLSGLAATTAGYVAKTEEDDTRIRDLGGRAADQTSVIVDAIKNNMEAAEKVSAEALKRRDVTDEKGGLGPEKRVSAVLDVEKEKKKSTEVLPRCANVLLKPTKKKPRQ
jgi:TP901 family phage tail tape measure protein